MPAQFVSTRDLERVRRRGARLVGEPPEYDSWWRDETSAEALVPPFGRLSVRPGLRLVTYASRGGSGEWAGRSRCRRRPAPGVETLVVAYGFEPDAPPGAPAHMEAIAGDGSLRSYVQASILAREISEIGAWWHGVDWGTHALVGPGAGPGARRRLRQLVPGGRAAGMLDESQWTWSPPPPDDWRPRAERGDDGGAVTVTF